MISTKGLGLTFGTSWMLINEVCEIPDLGMHSDPTILFGAVSLQLRAGYLQLSRRLHVVVVWVLGCVIEFE
jgi:hypothetical protein